MRLAFAVAAHLEPEILIVDEVLAVGDAEFQKKCLGKMQDVAGHGRTVLFVSHNMAAVQQLCEIAFFLKNGCLAERGPCHEVTKVYTKEGDALRTVSRVARVADEIVETVEYSPSTDCYWLTPGGKVDFNFVMNSAGVGAEVRMAIYDQFGVKMCQFQGRDIGTRPSSGSQAAFEDTEA